MRFATVLLLVLAMGLSACGRRHTAEDGAGWIFEHGTDWLVDALEEQDATDEQIAAAEAVIEQHQADVTAALTTLLKQHREMVLGLASGGDAAALLALEEPLRTAHVASLESIGTMHQEVGSAVGDETWQAATAYMNERLARRMRD
ncbi:MAG: hypothetical protein CL910_19155 [Deltaproteobacteria bacterium]|jgi:type IV pilus biogenesis protein CpaD/CtpE|nr:hypothetical protein [Deltaproteobacteria bacterium]